MNNLPTIKKDIKFNDIADVIGQASFDAPAMAHSFLKINRDHEDDEGRSIPAGSWTTTNYTLRLKGKIVKPTAKDYMALVLTQTGNVA